MKSITVPKDKCDLQGVMNLSQFSAEEIQPYLNELLRYFQDVTWPVFLPICKLLGSKFKSHELIEPINEILLGNDSFSKPSCFILMHYCSKQTLELFIPMIEKFSLFPTVMEMDEGLQHYAADLLFKSYEDDRVACYNKQHLIEFATNNSLFAKSDINLFESFSQICIKKYQHAFKIVAYSQFDPDILSLIYIVLGEVLIISVINGEVDLDAQDLDTSYQSQCVFFSKVNQFDRQFYFHQNQSAQNWGESLSKINLEEIILAILESQERIFEMRSIR